MKEKKKYLLFWIALFFIIGVTALANSVPAEDGKCDTPPDPPSLEPPAVVVIPPQIMKTSVTQTSNLISKRISQINAPRPSAGTVSINEHDTGISAGDTDQNFGIWANVSLTDSRDDRILRKTTAPYRGDLYQSDADFDLYNYIAGIDYKIADTVVIGVACSYEDIDDGTFAYASVKDRIISKNNIIDSKGFTVAPYFSVKIADLLTIDLNGGYSWLEIDQNRIDNDLSPEPITSSLDSVRMFGSATTNLYYSIAKWNIAASIGYLYAKEERDEYMESNRKSVDEDTIELGQLSVGGEVSYVINTVEPYLNLTYEYDTTYEEKVGEDFEHANYDKSGFIVGGGVRFQLTDNLLGDFQATGIVDREDYDEFSVAVNLRYMF